MMVFSKIKVWINTNQMFSPIKIAQYPYSKIKSWIIGNGIFSSLEKTNQGDVSYSGIRASTGEIRRI
ncbi:MAG: hypothetical protein COV66_02395 [Nitrospinae bacterium CG11_big_fil_rev_8_21_14_0_20_45_15]|nr:MAG: hypothetical protein COV66_02395 [Nitrospinae bacterium CG11_big_fil_rev_8_21_14_0_20_45_15]